MHGAARDYSRLSLRAVAKAKATSFSTPADFWSPKAVSSDSVGAAASGNDQMSSSRDQNGATEATEAAKPPGEGKSSSPPLLSGGLHAGPKAGITTSATSAAKEAAKEAKEATKESVPDGQGEETQLVYPHPFLCDPQLGLASLVGHRQNGNGLLRLLVLLQCQMKMRAEN
jgi:hypothetical protein